MLNWVAHTQDKSLAWAVDLTYGYTYTLSAHIHISQLQDSSQNFQTEVGDLIANASQYECSEKNNLCSFPHQLSPRCFILKTINLKDCKCK